MGDLQTERRVEYLDLDEILPAPRNPKLHAKDEIAGAISHFGLAELPMIDERTGRLVAGHGRINDLRSRRDNGQDPPTHVRRDGQRWLVPVLRGWASRSDEDAEAYLLTSNTLGALGGWDTQELTQMMADLGDADEALAALTGLTDAELAKLAAADPTDESDSSPPPSRRDKSDSVVVHECPACGHRWSDDTNADG